MTMMVWLNGIALMCRGCGIVEHDGPLGPGFTPGPSTDCPPGPGPDGGPVVLLAGVLFGQIPPYPQLRFHPLHHVDDLHVWGLKG
jgi:hypothetical protein